MISGERQQLTLRISRGKDGLFSKWCWDDLYGCISLWGCHNNISQSVWFVTSEIYTTVLEARNPKSRFGRARLTLGSVFMCSIVSSCLHRLLCPWKFSFKNIGVGCHFLPQESSQPRDGTVVSCMGRWILYHHHNHLGSLGKSLKSVSCSVVSDSLWPHGLYVACQAPLSMEFFRQEYWCGLPCPSPEDLPNSRDWIWVFCVTADTVWATKDARSRLPLKG